MHLLQTAKTTAKQIKFKIFLLHPEKTLKFIFKHRVGYNLDLLEPKTFNQKLQWLKLYWRDPRAPLYADKYSARHIVSKKGLSSILNDIYGVYDNPYDIDFHNLPDEFVIKVTHGSGQNIVCRNKESLNIKLTIKRLEEWLKISHYVNSFEWVYRDIKPRIIIEKLIDTVDKKPPKDYKVFCFNGEPKCLFVASDRGTNSMKFDFYDLEWNYLAVKNHYLNSQHLIARPKEINAIIDYSRILATDFPHVRVDFYIEQGSIIFGEFTFFHFSGLEPFEPKSFDYMLGEYLKLPK